ncbi:MAG: SRPBCC family protein [Opitutales bacterium]
MRFLKWFLIITVVFVGLVYIVGMMLPGDVRVERSATIEAPVEVIQPYTTDLELWQEWEPWGEEDDSMRVRFGEARKGVGASYSWSGEIIGQGTLQIIAIEPGERVDYILYFAGDEEAPAYSSFEFNPLDADTTAVIWSFEADLGHNPISRLLGRLVDGILGRFYEAGLENLARVAEHSAETARAADAEGASEPAT